MDREWFERRRHTLKTWGYINLGLGAAFAIAYAVARMAADTAYVLYDSHHLTRSQIVRYEEASSRAHVWAVLAVMFAIIGLTSFMKRLARRDEYNREILAIDPRIEGEFIPSLK